MREPVITIITPIYNGLPFLKECVASVLKQDFTAWEWLISDDGSTDGSREYLESLKDARIKIFLQPHNLGIFGNLNFLFRKASCELSQILCQDDYFVGSTGLSTIINYWNNAPADIGFVRFNHVELSESQTIRYQVSVASTVIRPDQSDLWFFVFGNIPGNLSNVSLRTKIVKEVGEFNQNLPFAGDFDFWIRAAKTVSMGVEKEVIVFVRRHKNVASNFLSTNGELFTQHIEIYERLIESLSTRYSKTRLIDYFNYEICSFHYRTAIKSAVNGKFTYLKNFVQSQSVIIWPKFKQLLVCLPYALFNGNQKYTVKLAKEFITPEV